MSSNIWMPDVEATKIRPVRTTNRTKRQIVHDTEKMWGRAIIPPVKPWHSLGDR